MKLDNVELHASPVFDRAYCPKCFERMVELDNGWFSVCWFCKKCENVYHLKMTKMRHVDHENLVKLLAEKGVALREQNNNVK